MPNDSKKNKLSDREVVLAYIGEKQKKANQRPAKALPAANNPPAAKKSPASQPSQPAAKQAKPTGQQAKAKTGPKPPKQPRIKPRPAAARPKALRKIDFHFWLGAAKSTGRIFLLALFLYAIIYLFFCFLLLFLGLDNKLSRQAAEFLPVPGLISTAGIIEYYPYKDWRALASANDLTQALVARKVLSSLGWPAGDSASFLSQLDKLDWLVLSDRQINKQAWAQIKKVRLAAGQNNMGLKAAAQKNGAEYGLVTLRRTEAEKRFGAAILSWPPNKISPAIIRPGGYYLVQVISRSGSLYTLAYAFIKGIGWSEYIAAQAEKSLLWQAPIKHY